MKKIFLLLLVFICFKVSAQYIPNQGKVAINTPLGLNLAAPLDGRSMFYDPANFVYRAYTDTTEVWNYLNQAKYRSGLFPIIVNSGGTLNSGVITGGVNTLWYYRNGTSRSNLVQMIFDSTSLSNRINHKVDTAYAINDSTLRIKINGNISDIQILGGVKGANPTSLTSVGNAYKVAVPGTSGAKSIRAIQYILIDSLTSGEIRLRVDTAGITSDYLPNHPFKLKVDPTYFSVLGTNADSLTCINCSGGGGGTGNAIQYKTIAAMVAATVPTDSTVIRVTGYRSANDSTLTEWIYLAGSSATANNMSIYSPASTVGRYFLISRNNTITFKQMGVFPSSDNTTEYFAALALVTARKWQIVHPANTIYTLAPTSTNNMLDSMNIIGEDSATSIIQTKTYATYGKDIFHYFNNAGDTLLGVKIRKIKFKGGQLFSNHTFAGGNPSPDTSATFISVDLGGNNDFSDNCFESGGTRAAIYIPHAYNTTIRRNTFKNIGGMGISTVYVQANKDVWVENNLAWSWGMRDRYDGGAPAGMAKVRFGDDFYECGGTGNHINYNILYNKAKTRWFWIEARVWGYNEVIGNQIHGEGMNSMGISYGNDPTPGSTLIANDNRIQNNTQDSTLYDVHTAADTSGGLSKYYASNLWEIGGMNGLQIIDNVIMSPHFTFARAMNNTYLRNKIHSPNSDNATETGAAIIYNFGTAQTGRAQIRNTIIEDKIFMNNGQIIRTTSGGDTIAGLTFRGTVRWTGDINVGELYAAAGGVNPTGISYDGSTFIGSAYRYIYTGTTSPISMSFSNVHGELSNMDSASNLVQLVSGAAPIINKENTTFSSGVYTSHLDSLRLNSSVVEARRAGLWKPQFTISGGSAPLAGIQTTVTNTSQVNADFRMNSYLSNYNWLTNTAQRGMNLTTAPNTAITYASGHMRLVGGNATDVISDSVSSSIERWQENVLGQVQSTGGSDYFAFGIYYQGIQEIYFKVKNSDLSTSVYYHANDSLIATIAGQGSSSVGDSVLYSIKKDNFSFVFTVTNKTKGTTASANFSFPKIDVSTNIAPFRIFNMTLNPVAGTFDVVRWQLINQERRHPDVMLAGHSIMAGYNSGAPDSTIYNRVQNLNPDKRMSLYGISGAVVNDFLSGVKLSDLLATRPEKIIWMLGVNEIQTGVALPTFISNYKKLIDTCEKYGIQTMITDCTPFNSTYKNAIIAYNTSLDSAFGNRVIHIWYAMQSNGLMINSTDSLHPNATGSRIVAAILDSAINAGWNVADNPRAVPKQFPDGTIQAYRKPGSQTSIGYIPLELGSQSTNYPMVGYNPQFDTTANLKYKQTDVLSVIRFNDGFDFINAPSGTAGTVPTLTNQWRINSNGWFGYHKLVPQAPVHIAIPENSGTDFNTGRRLLFDGTQGGLNAYFGIGFGYLNSNTYNPGFFGYQTKLNPNFTTGDFVWALRTAANETGDNAPTEFMRLTYAGILRLASYASGNEISVDTTNNKVAVFDASGNLKRMYWPAGSGGGYTDPLTTDGDIVVRASGATTRLAHGTTAQRLVWNGTALIWQDTASVQTSVVNGIKSGGIAPPWVIVHRTDSTFGQIAYTTFDPTTTTGDMIYRNSSGVLTRLPIGTTRQTLHVVGGIPAWVDTLAVVNTASSTYTPTLTSTTNITGSASLTQASYSQTGNIVTVTIGGNFQPTSSSTTTVLTVSLPISTATTTQSLIGSGTLALNSGAAGYQPGVVSVNGSTTATFTSNPSTGGGNTASFNIIFQYKTN